MKVIDLSDRVLFSDDIIEIYKEDYYYYVKTKNGDECIDEKDYYKIKDYLLSLNEDTPKEDKKIEILLILSNPELAEEILRGKDNE